MKNLLSQTLLITLVYVLILILPTTYSCSDSGINECFECKPTLLRHCSRNLSDKRCCLKQPLYPEMIPDGTYWVRIEIYDCFFTGNCTQLYKDQCPVNDNWDELADNPEHDVATASCSYKVTTNIPVFKNKTFIQERGIGLPFACTETASFYPTVDYDYKFQDSINSSITSRIGISLNTPPASAIL